jgi:DNA helicase-2/ATP-dependent DNA helicase PcrA
MTADLFGFQPSPQQAAFLDFAASGRGNAVLEACAGSGKTSTLTQGVSRMRGTKFLGAFNKSIAAELQKRVGSDEPTSRTAIASTMHSAGFAAWRRRHPKAAVLSGKTRKVFRQLSTERSFDHGARYVDYVDDMVSYAMNAGLGLDDPREIDDDKRWQAISNHFDADRSLDKRVGANEQIGIRWARLTLKRSLEMCPEAVSFDEMLYAPLQSGVRIQQFDNVLIDEAQDSSVPRILLAERMLGEGGRLFAVGDRHQSIYGFAGADASAMQNIVKRFDCTVLPLSVSFRCPRAVVWYAQQFAGLHIEPAPDAEEGISRRISLYPGWWREDKPKPHDAILCRFNAPLVGLAFAFLREGVPCRMAGRDELGATLKQLAKRRDSRTIDAVEAHLRDWLAEEIKVARLRDKPARANAAQDMVDTMQAIIDRCRAVGQHTVADLVAEIDRLFVKPKQPAVLLSSIHKAKGQEWPRVYWMQTSPKFSQPQEWQQQQEMNLKYVAATRAMHELVLVQE